MTPTPIAFQQIDPIQGAEDFLRAALRAADERVAQLEAQRIPIEERIAEIKRGRKGLQRAQRALAGPDPAPQRLLPPPTAESRVLTRAQHLESMDAEESLLTWAEAHGGEVVVKELAQDVGVHQATFNRALARLREGGQLVKTGPGVYRTA